MAARPVRLYTLDFPVTAEDMGDVHIYPLTPQFAEQWRELAKQWDRKHGFKTPHGSLGVALSTVTGRMVIMTVRDQEAPDAPLSGRSLIVSDGPLGLDLTRVCFDTWQTRHFGNTGERLSKFIDHDNTMVTPLHRALERDDAGYITGPWWWKNAVGWSITRRLAPHPLVDKTRPRRKVEFLTTTGGTLVAWNFPWVRTTNKGKSNQRRGYAMGYVSIRGETQRASKDPIVRIDCHVTRVAPAWNNVKTVHIKHPEFRTLLRVPVKHRPIKDAHGKDVLDETGRLRWTTTFKGHTADIVESCGLDPISLPEDADGNLEAVRPVFRNKGKHMIGKGPGAYFTLRMASHIRRVLGRDPVIYTATGYNIPGKSITSGPIPASKLPAALASSGWKSLRLVVLYDDDRTPARLCRTLQAEYDVDVPTTLCLDESPHDGASLEISPGITVVICKAPDVTMHGPHNRAPIIEKIPCLQPAGPDDLIAVICETRWSGALIVNDAKHPTRHGLADKRIPSQFIVATDHTDDQADDHPAMAAIRDILKSCGIADNRVAYAVAETPGTAKKAPLTEPVTLIGIHVRRHVYRKVKGRNRKASKLVVLLTAVHLKPEPDSSPHLEMYGDAQWRRYAEGLTVFHAGEIGNELWGRTGTGAQAARTYIEQALDNLILPDDTNRVVIMVDKEDARSIYPALGDNPNVTSPLPGQRLSDDGVDVSVVRIALGSHAARPATAYRDTDDLETMKPSYHMRVLFENNRGSEPTWLLTQASHQHQGANSALRIGSQMPRDDFDDAVGVSRMSKDMHATSRIEITVPGKTGAEAGALAVLVARLCDQSLAWDSRTSRPLPLHLPYTADKDHPDYKDHDPGGDAEDDELELDDE